MDCKNAEEYTAKMSLSCKNMRINVYKKTIEKLNNPEYIRFLLNKEKLHFAIQVCGRKDIGAVDVAACTASSNYYTFNTVSMIRMMWRICNWDEYSTYQLTGTIHEGYSSVSFDLKEAVKRKDEYDILLIE